MHTSEAREGRHAALPRRPDRSASTRQCLQLLLPALALLALLRFFPSRALALLPGCIIYRTTGMLCPGCGGTRALLALLHGDLRTAWHFNPLLLTLAPFAVAYALVTVRRGSCPRLPTPLIPFLSLVIIAFTLARNL